MGQGDRDDEVEQTRQQQRGLVPGVGGLVLADPEEVALSRQQPEEVDKGGVLDQRDELIDQGRKDSADALGDNHQTHAHRAGEPQRAGRLELA